MVNLRRPLDWKSVLLSWSGAILLSSVLYAQSLPVGTTVEARLMTAMGSRISRPGDHVEATVIAPVNFRGQIVIPQGATLSGSITSVIRLGLGLRHTTASLRFQFHLLHLPAGDTLPIRAQLLEVETAKERVDRDGVVHGIHPVASLSSSVAFFAFPLLCVEPEVGVPVWGLKSLIAPSANPELYFPPGAEIILQLTAPLIVRSHPVMPFGIRSFSPEEVSGFRQLLKSSAPQRAQQGSRPSDLVNVLLLGSRQQIDRAFQAAGWSEAERKSPLSLYRMYHALTKRMGYRMAPMNTLTLNGLSPDFVYQKSLNTVERRHHVRFWKQKADVWFGTAAEDIAFQFHLTHWTHSIDPRIDAERAKIVNDLAFTGCVEAAGLLSRHSPDFLQPVKAGSLLVTDHQIAIVRLNDCESPKTMTGVNSPLGLYRRDRWARSWTSLYNDLVRSNIFFNTYNTVKCLAGHQTSLPLRKAPNGHFNSTGLSWLNSLPPSVPTSAP